MAAAQTPPTGFSERQKIKIAFVTPSIGNGGAEAMLLKLIQNLDREAFQPSVVVLAHKTAMADQFESAGAQVLVLGGHLPLSRMMAFFRLFRVIRRLKPHLLQGWMAQGNLGAQLAGFMLRIPVLWGVRHSKLPVGREKPSTRFLNWTLRFLSSLPAKIIYNSHDGRLHHEAIGYRRSKSIVIPNGFDLAKFSPNQERRRQQRIELGIADDIVVIGMIARYHPIKDHANLLFAAQLLQGQCANSIFVLVGQGCDERNGALARTIDRLGLRKVMLLLGERENPEVLMNTFDVGALSSASEGFPNVIGELMACGVPCVTTDVGDCSWVIGDTGISVPPHNPSALAFGLAKLVRMPPDERHDLGTRARARIAEFFAIGSVVRRFAAVYHDTVFPSRVPTTENRGVG